MKNLISQSVSLKLDSRLAAIFCKAFMIFLAGGGFTACTKTEPEPIAQLASLNGSWKSDDFPLAVTLQFSVSDTIGLVTSIATNSHSFVKGDKFWRNVVATGANSYRLGQLTKSKSGYFAYVTGNATMTSPGRLEIIYSGETDDSGQLKLDGTRATFVKE